MTRREFLRQSGGAVLAMSSGMAFGASSGEDVFVASQCEIDRVTAGLFRDYLRTGNDFGEPVLSRLESAFDRVLAEVRSTVVAKRPAVWFVYNMGVIVKTACKCFSIDLMHRRAKEMEPLLDFALITHNHADHYTEEFYQAMNRAGKTVISNFKDNYGVLDRLGNGGYTRVRKEFQIGDVEIRTFLTDHNAYLVDFTTAFEICVGDFVLIHSGDCSNLDKLNPIAKRPNLWMVHPRCGASVVDGVRKFDPECTILAHLNELGHNKWRWSWKDGFDERMRVMQIGHKAIVPFWGERIA